MNKKLKWDKPQLIVLVRGGAGEMVLEGCKGYGVALTYTMNRTHSSCIARRSGAYGCVGDCNSIVSS